MSLNKKVERMLIKDSYGDFSFIIPVDVHGQKAFKMFPFNAENAAVHAEINKPILRTQDKPSDGNMDLDKLREVIKEIVDLSQNILDQDNVTYVDFKKKKKID